MVAFGGDGKKELFLFVSACIGVGWYIGLWAIGILGCYSMRKSHRLRPRSPLSSAPASSVPGVSILRPLKGLDTNLYENLETTFTQEYPNYEVLFSVASETDQALSIVRDLIAKYPHVKAKIIVGDENIGVNPKVNNLIKPYREAANDILWVIDSNVQVHPGTLARSVDALSRPTSRGKRVALVHHVPYAYATESALGSRVEEAFINTNHAKMYVAINTVAIESCVIGKSNLYRRSEVEQLNASLKPHRRTNADPEPEVHGLAAFANFLAEDNMIASALWHELDMRHDLSCDVAKNIVGRMSLTDYIDRRVRWIRVRKHMVFVATLLEPLTESLVLCTIGACSMRYLVGFPVWLLMLVHFAALLFVDLDVYNSLAGHPLPAAKRWSFISGWAVREVLALPIFLLAIFGDTVIWRGKRYKVLRHGQVSRTEVTGSILDTLRGRIRPKDYQPLATDASSV